LYSLSEPSGTRIGVCPYLDAEALVLVAVEDLGDGIVSVGMRCPLHALPKGCEERMSGFNRSRDLCVTRSPTDLSKTIDL